MLLKNYWITEEIKKDNKKYLETNENENTMIQNLWDTAKAKSKREVYSDTSLPQETRKISNKLTWYLKQLEIEEQTKPKISKKKKNLRERAVEKKDSGPRIRTTRFNWDCKFPEILHKTAFKKNQFSWVWKVEIWRKRSNVPLLLLMLLSDRVNLCPSR